jgi:glycosyltransferase involved in cell wall biosynthesis
MQKDQLKVGTLTANYNNGIELPQCLNSLVNQTRKPDVMVVVDDKSQDNSLGIIKGLTDFQEVLDAPYPTFFGRYKDIPLFVVALPENKGPAGARNAGLRILLGLGCDAISIADADDVYYEDKIRQSLDIMIRYPQVGLVYTDYDILHTANGSLKREFKESYSFRRLFEECIVSNNSMISAKIFSVVGAYDESLRGPEDYDLWLRIAENCAVYHIPEALYQYRVTGKNITVTTPSNEFAAQVSRVHQKAIARRDRSLRNAGF